MSKKEKKTPVPNFANATPEFLTDELGAIRKKISALEKEKDQISEALKGRARLLEQYSFKGEVFTAEIVDMERTGLDADAIRSEMDEDWVAEHSKTTSYQQINTKAI